MGRIVVFARAGCMHCIAAKNLLTSLAIPFSTIDIEAHPDRRAEAVRRSGKGSVPQIFLNNTLVAGGAAGLAEMHAAGQLESAAAAALGAETDDEGPVPDDADDGVAALGSVQDALGVGKGASAWVWWIFL
jgi:glutaredoxin 3